MKTFQKSFLHNEEITTIEMGFVPEIILLFVSPGYSKISTFLELLTEQFPDATIAGCSTSGEIIETRVEDNTIVLNAISFDKAEHRVAKRNISSADSSMLIGKELIKEIYNEELRHVLILSDGLQINGDELVSGLNAELPAGIGVTGGLAGDGTNFEKTFIILNNEVLQGAVIAIGFYGASLEVNYSSQGGGTSFGLERRVTKSDKNVLYEIDGEPALKLYKSYLGEKAHDLPGSGLLFPLMVRVSEDNDPLVRTLLSVDEDTQSITFAGNIPEGSFVRLMKANVDRLINGAEGSASLIKESSNDDADFAIIISCVGRRLVLKQLVEEEVEAVREVFGDRPKISGFYSYGELAPFEVNKPCRLHNQTMTITTFSENMEVR